MTIAAVSGQVEVVAVSVSNWAAITFDSDVTAGNLIVVLASRWYQSDGVAFVAGDLVATGTATLAAAPSLDASVHGGADAATSSAIWSAIVTETGTLTLTLDVDEVPLDASGYGVLIAEEYTGSFDASRLEDTTSGSGTGTAVSAGSMTSAGAALMVGLCLPWGGSPTFTPGSGWTQIAESEGTSLSGNAERRIVVGSTTDDPDWTMGSSLAWQAVGATYKEVAGAGPTGRAFLLGGKLVGGRVLLRT